MTQLVRAEPNGSVVTIEDLLEAVGQISSIAEAKEANAQIKAFEVYARARKSIQLVNETTELRIWAERKGGEMLAREGLNSGKAWRDHGIQPSTALRWMTLALTEEAFIRQYTSECRTDEKEISVHTLIRRSRDFYRRKIAPGVFKELRGGYSIEFKTQEGFKKRIGGIQTKEKALQALHQYKRIEAIKPLKAPADLSVAYSLIRRCLASLVKMEATERLTEAVQLAYKMEDLLSAEIRASAGQDGDK